MDSVLGQGAAPSQPGPGPASLTNTTTMPPPPAPQQPPLTASDVLLLGEVLQNLHFRDDQAGAPPLHHPTSLYRASAQIVPDTPQQPSPMPREEHPGFTDPLPLLPTVPTTRSTFAMMPPPPPVYHPPASAPFGAHTQALHFTPNTPSKCKHCIPLLLNSSNSRRRRSSYSHVGACLHSLRNLCQ